MMHYEKFLRKIFAALFFIGSVLTLVSAKAADQHGRSNKSHPSSKQTSAGSKKKTDAYSGWEVYQTSKSMGTNRLMLCAGGLKVINPLMSMAYWPKSNQLVMINNANHKYFLCTKEKFPHYVKMLGFDIFGSSSKEYKYSEWKKLDTEPVASMNCALYERQALNVPAGGERKEQTWVSNEISLPPAASQVYSELSGRQDACKFGFPLRSKVLITSPQEGFKVRVDFDTREVSTKQFTASDFLLPKDYILVKEFSEFLMNDSESKTSK
jgi:hypothetical protein